MLLAAIALVRAISSSAAAAASLALRYTGIGVVVKACGLLVAEPSELWGASCAVDATASHAL